MLKLKPVTNKTFVDATMYTRNMVLHCIAPKNLSAHTFRVKGCCFLPISAFAKEGAHMCDKNDLRLASYQPFLADSHNLIKFIYAQTGKYLKGVVTFFIDKLRKKCVI